MSEECNQCGKQLVTPKNLWCPSCDTMSELPAPACSASEQNEFETLDEAWNALLEARAEIARLRMRIGEHDGCSRWGVKDAIALKPNAALSDSAAKPKETL